jgi:hypothetical protein
LIGVRCLPLLLSVLVLTNFSRMSMQEFPEPEYDYDEENKDEVGATADK